jgi:hypothetical protein
MPAEMTDRRFPPQWTLDEHDECFIVRDANGQALAYVYFEEEPGRARGGEAPHPDVALPMQRRAEDCVTVQSIGSIFIRRTGEYQCRTRSKLRRSESAASMQYRC